MPYLRLICFASAGALAASLGLAGARADDRGAGGPAQAQNWRALTPPLPEAPEREQPFRQVLGAKAQVLRSDHFAIVHDAEEAVARDLAVHLEAVYRANVALARELELVVRRPAHKLPVLVYRRYEDFRADGRRVHAAADALGFYDPARGCGVFFDLNTYPSIARLRAELTWPEFAETTRRRQRAARLARNTEALLAKVIQHEAAHQIQDQTGMLSAGCAAPTWLVEGAAELFELPFVERGATLDLAANRYRLTEFTRLHADASRLLTDLRRLVADEVGKEAAEDYSLSWALVDYLYKRQRASLGRYWRTVAGARASPTTAPAPALAEFERSFGTLDDGWAQSFETYMLRLQARYGTERATGP